MSMKYTIEQLQILKAILKKKEKEGAFTLDKCAEGESKTFYTLIDLLTYTPKDMESSLISYDSRSPGGTIYHLIYNDDTSILPLYINSIYAPIVEWRLKHIEVHRSCHTKIEREAGRSK